MSDRKLRYWEQLKDPRWQERRLTVLLRANFTCECCGVKPEGESLEVHHRYYKTGKMAWEYTDRALVCLCGFCHQYVPDYENELLESIDPKDTFQIANLRAAIAFAKTAGHDIEWCCTQIFAGLPAPKEGLQ